MTAIFPSTTTAPPTPTMGFGSFSWPIASLHRWSVAEYHQMLAAGILKESECVELLKGHVVQKMARNPAHDTALQKTNRRIQQRLSSGWDIRMQMAITLFDSEPEPDLTIVRGDENTFSQYHPTPAEIGFVVEIANTTLQIDRLQKGMIYAEAAITIYWIVNIVDRVVEVYTDPSGITENPGYNHVQTYALADAVPVIFDGQTVGTVPVAEMLP